ncbi:MAG: thiamine diphosphokinase [Anaerolineales bacterium]|nr:thiamine diphosphokinase [Anaerolineales bacterium]
MTNTLPQGVFIAPGGTALPPTQNARRAAIFANGPLPDLAGARRALAATDRLIAADGGLRHLRALGLTPHLLVGDLDSVTPAEAHEAVAAGAQVEQHPARKDETDLELALRRAVADGAQDVLIFGALGGRWDQTLANLLLLAHPAYRAVRLRLLDGPQQIYLVRGATAIEGRPGDTVSLVPLSGDARGVTTTGLDYPLHNGMLPFGGTLGISNVLIGSEATVSVGEGLVACIVFRPGAEREKAEHER